MARGWYRPDGVFRRLRPQRHGRTTRTISSWQRYVTKQRRRTWSWSKGCSPSERHVILCGQESGHYLFGARLIEINLDLVPFDADHRTIAEFLMNTRSPRVKLATAVALITVLRLSRGCDMPYCPCRAPASASSRVSCRHSPRPHGFQCSPWAGHRHTGPEASEPQHDPRGSSSMNREGMEFCHCPNTRRLAAKEIVQTSSARVMPT